MSQPQKHPQNLLIGVIILFLLGLSMMAVISAAVPRAAGGWGQIQSGWLNQAAGSGLILGGLGLVLWSIYALYMDGNGTPYPKVATRVLVTGGPYRYTRNPMTLGALLLYVGIGVWLGSALVVILAVIVISSLLAFIYIHETRELSGRFGEEYREYRKQTPFLVPRCRRRG